MDISLDIRGMVEGVEVRCRDGRTIYSLLQHRLVEDEDEVVREGGWIEFVQKVEEDCLAYRLVVGGDQDLRMVVGHVMVPVLVHVLHVQVRVLVVLVSMQDGLRR